jgi:hypothetical protein
MTLVGIYGVLSLSVASRRRESAIRSAVGAQQKDIRNLIFGEGWPLFQSPLLCCNGLRRRILPAPSSGEADQAFIHHDLYGFVWR